VDRWLLEQTERADGTGREPQPSDPVDHIAGDRILLDLVIDRADRLVDDEALDLRIVREWIKGRDELALVNQLDACPCRDDGHRQENGSEHDAHGAQQRSPPSAPPTGTRPPCPRLRRQILRPAARSPLRGRAPAAPAGRTCRVRRGVTTSTSRYADVHFDPSSCLGSPEPRELHSAIQRALPMHAHCTYATAK